MRSEENVSGVDVVYEAGAQNTIGVSIFSTLSISMESKCSNFKSFHRSKYMFFPNDSLKEVYDPCKLKVSFATYSLSADLQYTFKVE